MADAHALGACLRKKGEVQLLSRAHKFCYYLVMKWWLIGGWAFLAGATVVMAQSVGDLYAQAVDAGTQYRSAYSAYVQAKNQHLQYNTGTTRVEAIGKTNAVLISRNKWLIDYLKYLRQMLAEVTTIANYPQTVVYLGLENQINSLSGLTELGQGDSFTKINAASNDWEKRLEQMDKLIGVSQLQISSTKLANFQNQLGGYMEEYIQNHSTPSALPAGRQAAQATTLTLITDKLAASIADRKEVDQQLAVYNTGYWSASSYIQQLDRSHQQLLEAAKLLAELTNQP